MNVAQRCKRVITIIKCSFWRVLSINQAAIGRGESRKIFNLKNGKLWIYVTRLSTFNSKVSLCLLMNCISISSGSFVRVVEKLIKHDNGAHKIHFSPKSKTLIESETIFCHRNKDWNFKPVVVEFSIAMTPKHFFRMKCQVLHITHRYSLASLQESWHCILVVSSNFVSDRVQGIYYLQELIKVLLT